jgi:hypothetical protein
MFSYGKSKQACWHTVSSIKCNKTSRSEKSDIDYHLLGTSLFNNIPRKKVKMMEIYMKGTIKRIQQDQPAILSHSDIRRCYTKGSTSIYRQMPVPPGISGGEALSHFTIAHVENAMNHLLSHGFPLKMLKINKSSDWKNSNECFHTLFHQELYKKLQKLEHCPENLHIHLQYIWSDGFQKNTLVKTKKYCCNFLLFMLCCLMVFETLQYTFYFLHLEQNKRITIPN